MMMVLLPLLHYNVYWKKVVQHLHLNSAGNIFAWNDSFSARIRSIAVVPFTPRLLGQNGAEPSQAEYNGNGIQLCESPRIF